MAPVKDYPTLLRAFARLEETARLRIVGEGPDERQLRAIAVELNIASRVEFTGFQERVEPLLREADGFVLASLWEGLPVSVLEASAAGLPLVATDAPGTREAMLPGESGLLAPVGDVPALAAAMAQVMNMAHDERAAMGAQGRALVERRFTMTRVADRWEEIYAALLQTHRRPARSG